MSVKVSPDRKKKYSSSLTSLMKEGIIRIDSSKAQSLAVRNTFFGSGMGRMMKSQRVEEY